MNKDNSQDQDQRNNHHGVQLQQGEIRNPFVGPRPFSQDLEDQKLFFGRNYESEKIISLIYSHKLVLIYAQSGAGKTSLFNAKIVPELQKRGLQVLPIARVGFGSNITDRATTDAPKDDKEPVSNSIDNLYLLNTFQSLGPNISDYSVLKNQSLSEFLEIYFPHQVNQRGKDIPQVIIFDQFEELFNFFSDPTKWQQHQQDFFSNISDALENDPLLRIVFVIREDYLAQMDPFVSNLPEKLKPRLRLERLGYDEAIQAIKGPLEILNYDVPIDEIEQIVRDLTKIKVETIAGRSLEVLGEFVEPIQLQVVCQRWWYERFISKNIQSDTKYLSDSDLTNVDKSLEDFYVKSIQSAVKQTKVKEEDLRRWCEENLITSSGTRSNIHLEAGSTKGIPNKAIEILAQLYLVRREWRAGAYWYELTHDRLIKPIKESNKEWTSKKIKSKRTSRIKVILPVLIISIIGISLYLSSLQSNYQNELEQQKLELKQEQKLVQTDKALLEQLTNGIKYYGIGNYKQANLEFTKALSINPNSTDALYYKGLTLQQLSQDADSELYYKKLRAIDPNYLDTLGNTSTILADLDSQDQEAITWYDKTLVEDPNNVNALTSKGDALYGLGQYKEAMALYDKALAINPNYTYALVSKGIVIDNLGKNEEAITWYDKALAVDPSDVHTLTNKGLALYNLGKNEEAITWYDKALAVDPSDVYTLTNKGLALDSLGKYEEAITWYDKALAIDPSDVYAPYNKGVALDSLAKYEEAITWYDKALAIDPDNIGAINNIGSALNSLGKYEEAITWYDKVLGIDPNYIDALSNKGLALDNLGKYEEAISWYNKVLAIDPNYTDALNSKAFVLAKLDKNEEAVPLIEKALESAPDNKYYLSTAAFIKYNLGKDDEAKNYYDKALKIDPDLKDMLEEIELNAFNSVMK